MSTFLDYYKKPNVRKTDLQIWQLQHRQIAENIFAKSLDYLELDALIRYNIVIL